MNAKLAVNNSVSSSNNQTWLGLTKVIEELLERREALLPSITEFKEIDDALTNYFKGVDNCKVGNYEVSSKLKEEELFYLPQHLKKKYIKKTKKWVIEIKKL